MARSGNPNPVMARAARARKRAAAQPDAGGLDELRAAIWLALDRCRAAIADREGVDQETRAVMHCMGQLASTYIRLIEAHDLQARIEALEAQA